MVSNRHWIVQLHICTCIFGCDLFVTCTSNNSIRYWLNAKFGTQVKDDLAGCKALFAAYIQHDERIGECASLLDRCKEALKLARCTEFESWIVRICLGGASTKCRNPAKALGAKQKVAIHYSVTPADDVHKALWKLGKATLGLP
jgi:hypothetical protein